jgi:hypothetical protein
MADDETDQRFVLLERRVIKLAITEVLFSSIAGMVLGTVGEDVRKDVMTDLRALVAETRWASGPIDEFTLQIEEEAARSLDNIELIADDYRKSKKAKA